jgi:putative flippase GtrA
MAATTTLDSAVNDPNVPRGSTAASSTTRPHCGRGPQWTRRIRRGQELPMLSGAAHDYLARAGKLVLLLRAVGPCRPEQDTRPKQHRATRIHQVVRVGVKFAIVGLSGVAVNSAVLFLLYRALHVPLFPSSLVAVEVSIVTNYLLNDRWTFSRARPSWRLFAKFNLATAGALLVTPTAVWSLVHLGLHFLLANIIGITIGAALNFATSTLWVWGLPEGGARLCSTSSSGRSSSSR